MTKTTLLISLTAFLCTLAATTTPANAWFQHNTAQETNGPISKFPAKSELTVLNGINTAVVACESTATTKATGFWQIQTSEEITKEVGITKEQTQPPTKLGPHESLTIEKWGTCSTKINNMTPAATEVTACRLQVAQPIKSTGNNQLATGSVQTTCQIKILGCVATVLQETANHNLKEVVLNPAGTNGVFIAANITGLTVNFGGQAACIIPFKNTKLSTGTFSTGASGSEAIQTAGQKLV